MCLCCCITRKFLLIYGIVTSAFAFIYRIVAISKFGSRTEIYKILVEYLKELEKENQYSTSSTTKNNNNYIEDYYDYFYNSNSNNNKNDDYYSSVYGNNYNSKVVKAILDSASYAQIKSLTPNDLQQSSYNLIKSLKGI